MNKKIFTILGIAVVIIALLIMVAEVKSSKIKTFEECKKAGWLMRGIRVYDGIGSIEQECFLWTGKSFVKYK